MVLPEDGERKLYRQFNDLCRDLNLDKATYSDAWRSFSEIYEPYTLAGNPLHWMGCALYVACKSSTAPTVSKSSVVVQGNLVNLKGLLKLIDLNIVEFFIKIRRWANFANLSEQFLKSLDQLERDFTVSMVLFKKFQPIFADLFMENNADKSKNKKKGVNVVPLARIFDFSWTLFIFVKSNYPKISDDLVNSYHLLLACFDFVFVNVYMSGRKDIINPNFPIPQTMKVKCVSLADVSCILDVLCSRHDGISVQAKSIKEYCWRKHIKQMFDRKILKGNSSFLCDIVDISYFEQNFKAVNKHYEEYMLSVGTFDERIFLGRSTNPVATEGSLHKLTEISEQLEAKRKSLHRNAPMTPLTGRQYLPERTSPASSNEQQNFASFQSLVSSWDMTPSEFLRDIINSCETKPPVEETVLKLSEQTKSHYLESDNVTKEQAERRCNIVLKLFYKFIDSLLTVETKKPNFDAKVLLKEEIFIKTLYACSFEVMAFLSLRSHRYPWISKVLGLPHYYFYKIIEVVVRTEDSLSRDVVKHLNTIEEKILDSLSWQRDSPLWKDIIESDLVVPTCEKVCNRTTTVECTPTKQIPEQERLALLKVSPGGTLAEKFAISPQNLNKRPSDGENENNSKLMRPENPIDSSKSSGLSIQKQNSSQDLDNESSPSNMNGVIKKPKKTGSLALFFRKFYYLAKVRMDDLCKQLSLTDEEVRQKIWTCFEETIVRHCGLMLDRHLDQILMCSIYLISKVVVIPLQFTDVMRCYRNQPQASSNVYREVLMSPDLSLDDIKDPKFLDKVSERKEVRNDIIKFYNSVFINKHKPLVKKLNSTGENDRIVLSPIPVGLASPPNTPRRISDKHSLFLRSFDQKLNENSPLNNAQLSYKFSRSPAKDLKAINYMVSKADVNRVGKRLLNDDDENGSTEKSNPCSMLPLLRKVCNERDNFAKNAE